MNLTGRTLEAPARPSAAAPARFRMERVCLLTGLAALSLLAGWMLWFGFDYYLLAQPLRMRHPLHAVLKPGGTIGLRLGITGFALFVFLYLYAARKRWAGMSRFGKTKTWLNFHVLAGIAAPVLITFHSSFKFQGIAGVAYWIMLAVMLSGIAGRYLYAQIPRSLSAAELSFQELEQAGEALAAKLEAQQVFSAEELRPLLEVPSRVEVKTLPLAALFLTMLKLDLARPLRVAALRRSKLGGLGLVRSAFGFLSSGREALEDVIHAARRQSWLMAKIVFLERAQQIFHLWHVVHRPFSYSFAVLIVVHISIVVLMGYY